MKTRRILASLLLLPYLTVSGFQGNAATSVRRKRALPFLKQQVLAVEGETSTDDSAVDASCPLDELPPVIQQIADDRKEFQLNLGRAMDTLRKDYPDILHKKPGTYEILYTLGHRELFAHSRISQPFRVLPQTLVFSMTMLVPLILQVFS